MVNVKKRGTVRFDAGDIFSMVILALNPTTSFK